MRHVGKLWQNAGRVRQWRIGLAFGTAILIALLISAASFQTVAKLRQMKLKLPHPHGSVVSLAF
jgi:CHASE3 domain sensor protein